MIRIGCSFKPRGCPGSDGMRDTWFNDDTATWIDAWSCCLPSSYCSLSPATLAFCTTTTLVAVYFPDGPTVFCSSGLGELSFFVVGIIFEFAYFLGSIWVLALWGVASTSEPGKGKKGGQPREGVDRTNSEKSIELLIER
ncbi:hypothetical protein CK203_053360 [Vitis vinifera]|uniref:Uncharacterized protein n=1 Tax=Vitis vinifera TaxID=29760 RepID=A0A438GWB1_VITVI|nr:hypothetical protein CK203_053360 [Vitis vinifera]